MIQQRRLRVVVVLLLGLLGLASGFTHPRRQHAMRMSHRGQEPLKPPGDNDLEALERKLPPSVAMLLRTLSTVAMGSAYLASPVMAPRPAEAVTSTTVLAGNVMEAGCLGFGCGTYQGTDFNGAPKPTDEPSIDMPAFLKAVDEKRVEKVELMDGGNVGYAFVRDASTPASGEGAGGAAAAAAEVTRLRIGEGFPVDNPKAWSSPLWVVRVLKDKAIPYTLDFDFSGAALGGSRDGPPKF